MHSVLHLQTDRLHPQEPQTLKHGLAKTRFGCFLAHDNRAQLAVIPNQHDLIQLSERGGMRAMDYNNKPSWPEEE